jgi:hypothetical protein
VRSLAKCARGGKYYTHHFVEAIFSIFSLTIKTLKALSCSYLKTYKKCLKWVLINGFFSFLFLSKFSPRLWCWFSLKLFKGVFECTNLIKNGVKNLMASVDSVFCVFLIHAPLVILGRFSLFLKVSLFFL